MTNGGEDRFVFRRPTTRRKDVQEPIVFLFGWTGCKNQYLDKYAKLYNLNGYATIQLIIPNDALFWRQDDQQRLVNTTSDSVFRSDDQHLVLCHVFSVAGCHALIRFLRYLNTTVRNVHLGGLIFDSCPAIIDARARGEAYAGAAYESYGPWIKRAVASVVPMLFGLCDIYRNTPQWIRGLPGARIVQPYNELWKFDLRCPMLFLYSKADKVCNYASIEEYIEEQRRRGVQVSQVQFDDSPHCQHARVHTERYNDAVKKFLFQTVGPASIAPISNDHHRSERMTFDSINQNTRRSRL